MGSRIASRATRRIRDGLTDQTHSQNGTEEAFHDADEEAVESVRADLGGYHAHWIGGEAVDADDRFDVTSPGDPDLTIGEFAAGGRGEVDAAVSAARTSNSEPVRRAIDRVT